MRRLWSWLKSWWGIGRVSRQLFALDLRLDRLDSDRRILSTRRQAHEINWEMINKEMQDVANQAKDDLDKADALVKRYEEELEAARSKITTYEESTIPTLVAANATFKDLWDAVSAEQIRRRVVAAPVQEEIT